MVIHKMHVITMHFMDDHFVNLGEEVIGLIG